MDSLRVVWIALELCNVGKANEKLPVKFRRSDLTFPCLEPGYDGVFKEEALRFIDEIDQEILDGDERPSLDTAPVLWMAWVVQDSLADVVVTECAITKRNVPCIPVEIMY